MKKLFLLLVMLLAGCSTLLDAYNLKYDNNEYQLINDIRTSAMLSISRCGIQEEAKIQAQVIANKTLTFKNYVEFLPDNKNIQIASSELNDIAQGLLTAYNSDKVVSPVFCKIKYETLVLNAAAIQRTAGAKPK